MTRSRSAWDHAAAVRADDPVIDALPAPLQSLLADVWQARAGMELHVAGGFAVIARELLETGADPTVSSIVADAVSDEIEHARVCLSLAERHDGRARPWPSPEPLRIPCHEDVGGATLAALHLVAMSCLNESIATVRLGDALEATRSPVVTAGLRAILTDEVVHARAGWAHLGSSFVDGSTRRAVELRLAPMVGASLRGLFDENVSLPRAGHAELGLPALARTCDVAIAALDEVVFPGFEAVGIDPRPARVVAHRWREAQDV